MYLTLRDEKRNSQRKVWIHSRDFREKMRLSERRNFDAILCAIVLRRQASGLHSLLVGQTWGKSGVKKWSHTIAPLGILKGLTKGSPVGTRQAHGFLSGVFQLFVINLLLIRQERGLVPSCPNGAAAQCDRTGTFALLLSFSVDLPCCEE